MIISSTEYKNGLKTLKTKNWLNDIFMNACGHIIGWNAHNFRNFAILGSFTIAISQRSARKLKLPIYDIKKPIFDIFVFQNKNDNHWNLWHYNAKRNTFKVYDSMKDDRDNYIDFANQFMKYVRVIFPFVDQKPAKMIFPRVPQQQDAYNCGVYSLLFLNSILITGGRVKLDLRDDEDVRVVLRRYLPDNI